MGNNTQNVTTGKPKITGAVFWAPLETKLPTSSSETLDPAFKALGYVSEDGVSNDNSPESETIKAWGGDTVISMQTQRPDTFKLKLIEAMNTDVLGIIYGKKNVTATEEGEVTIKATAEEMEAGCYVIDMILTGNRAKRIVIPNGVVSEVGTITYKDNEAVGYEITITDVPDKAGVYHYEYIAAANKEV